MGMTRSNLRLNIRSICGIINDRQISDSDINTWIDLSIAEVHQYILQADDDHFTVEQSLQLTGANAYALPLTFEAMRMVIRTNNLTRVEKIDFLHTETLPTSGDRAMGYSVIKQNIQVWPSTATELLKIYYVPKPPVLASDSASLPAEYPATADTYIIHAVCTLAKAAMMLDPGISTGLREEAKNLLCAAASGRDRGFTKQLQPLAGSRRSFSPFRTGERA